MNRKKILIGLIVYVALIVLCLIVVYLFPQLRGVFTPTYITEQYELNIQDDVTGYIIRDEKVYTAAADSKVKRLAKEDTLYKSGNQAVSLTPSTPQDEENENKYRAVMGLLGKNVTPTDDGIAKAAGYISYKIDGYEARLTPDNIEDIKMSEYKAMKTSLLTDTVKGQCYAGDPIYKVTNNGKWYMVFFVDIEDMYKYVEGRSVQVTLGDITEKAYINEVTEGVHVARVVLKCGFMYDGWLTDREVDARITTVSAKGLRLETKSIVERDGVKGVLVKDKLGNYTFKRVSIKADDGKTCVAYQDLFMDENGEFVKTIGIYDEIVKRPSEKEIKEAA